ncbi:MAG: transglycosylase domain-containing protein [Lachnospiraceae bacterium]|nr:transglycosylase domain-containing protein [Lachnospiraceae bacterium]
MRIYRLIGLLVVVMVCGFVCMGFTVAGKGYAMYQEALEGQSLEAKVAEIRGKKGYTELAALPAVYLDAVISVEDHRFYQHFGVDLIAVVRAVVNDVRARRFVEGGSTITQQLAKNLYFSQEKELTRKVAEVFLALDLERNYSKDEILELYVNSIYYGDGYYNIGTACAGYFGKLPEEMTQYESTLLAGVPNAPSRYAPTKNPELAKQRQMQVIRRMEACGCFSKEEAETVALEVVAAN